MKNLKIRKRTIAIFLIVVLLSASALAVTTIYYRGTPPDGSTEPVAQISQLKANNTAHLPNMKQNDAVELEAWLTPISPGITVTFIENTTVLGTANTNTSGIATYTYTVSGYGNFYVWNASATLP